MNKISLIIKREYLSRVKKRSFLLVTFLLPLFIIGAYAMIAYFTAKSFEGNEVTVHVVDQGGTFKGALNDTKNLTFVAVSDDTEHEKKEILGKQKTMLLVIPADFAASPRVELFAGETANMITQNEIRRQLEGVLRARAYERMGLSQETIDSLSPSVNLVAKEVTEAGEKDSSAGAAMGVAMGLSVLVYLCLFLYGAQVMRGIIEEKSNRIVEVVISSVKPFQLMMGKIIGIGLVGLTQFVLWFVLSVALMGVAGSVMGGGEAIQAQVASQQGISVDQGAIETPADNGLVSGALTELGKVDFRTIIICFFFYFLGGYMLYSALFAAVGSAVDSETETQQFMFPLTIPLLFTYIMSFGVLVNDPHGPLAFWLSMIPLTSPIAMLVRIPFGVPLWEIALSLALLVGGFLLTTWVAGRIYRVGILMYGKKASYKELIKWFRYKG